MSASSTTPRPAWLKPTPQDYVRNGLNQGSVAGSPTLLFDWEYLGQPTGLRFVVINTGAGVLTVTPEAAYRATGPAEVGPAAPAAFTVQPGQCYGDPYGIDEMRPYWRIWINGTSAFEWGVMGIPR